MSTGGCNFTKSGDGSREPNYNFPQLTSIISQINYNFGHYKYTVYRCASKFVALQKKFFSKYTNYTFKNKQKQCFVHLYFKFISNILYLNSQQYSVQIDTSCDGSARYMWRWLKLNGTAFSVDLTYTWCIFCMREIGTFF